MIKLNCPNCGGHLEIPDNLEIAHCMYCGTRILLQENEINRERINLKRYRELCKTAVDALNFEEALQYSNKILEIDTKDVDAWIYKAYSSFWVTGGNNGFHEAMEYLRKADSISPNKNEIKKAREKIIEAHSVLLFSRAGETLSKAYDTWNMWADGTNEGLENARYMAQDQFEEAVEFILEALSFNPGQLSMLETLATITDSNPWIPWDDKVKEKVLSYKLLKRKLKAQSELPNYRNELKKAEDNLFKIRKEKGLFIKSKIKDAESKVIQLKRKIASLEDAASYELPKTNIEY